MGRFVVVGQIARDLVLLVSEVPSGGSAVAVRERREMLGGKGANQAVALTQLGGDAVLVGVVGDDPVGTVLTEQASADRLDVRWVVRRRGARTGLIVDVVDENAEWRYLEDLDDAVLLSEPDIRAAADAFTGAGTVLVQLQQPGAAAVAAAELAAGSGARVILDGVPGERCRSRLLAAADVLRADRHEAEVLSGASIRCGDDAVRVGRGLLAEGPSLVVLGAGDDGDAFVHADGELVQPLLPVDVVDRTGAGDAFLAALAVGLDRGLPLATVAGWAGAAAACTVGRLGGRPALRLDDIRRTAERYGGR